MPPHLTRRRATRVDFALVLLESRDMPRNSVLVTRIRSGARPGVRPGSEFVPELVPAFALDSNSAGSASRRARHLDAEPASISSVLVVEPWLAVQHRIVLGIKHDLMPSTAQCAVSPARKRAPSMSRGARHIKSCLVPSVLRAELGVERRSVLSPDFRSTI